MKKNRELYPDMRLSQYAWLKKFTKEIRFTYVQIPVESGIITIIE